MSHLSTKFTGVVFTPQEFRTLHQCLTCGKAELIKNGERCSTCKPIEIKQCEICSIILRDGIFNFYSYDIKDEKRHTAVEFKPNKKFVREFASRETIENIFSETLCKTCADYKNRMKDICVRCDNDFYNNKEHYKEHANVCPVCVNQIEADYVIGFPEDYE